MLAVLYLIFNEGYTASTGDQLTRADLCAEAIRLGRLLATLMPDEPEVIGLLALMLLTESRRAARTAPDGSLVLLADQDRSRWDRGLIAEGQALVRQCLRRGQPGPYQIQAAINAVHADTVHGDPADGGAGATDWGQILQLYDQLLAVAPSPVVALHRAVAVAEVDGPARALALVDELGARGRPGQRAQPRRLLPAARHPRRPAPAAGPDRRGGRRLRRGPGLHRQRRRTRLPPPPASPPPPPASVPDLPVPHAPRHATCDQPLCAPETNVITWC